MTNIVQDTPAVPYGSASAPVLAKAGNDPRWFAGADDSTAFRAADDMLAGKMEPLVKGAGYARVGGNMPLSDDAEIFRRAMRAETSFRGAIKKGCEDPQSVVKGMSGEFGGQFGAFLAAGPQNQAVQQWTASLANALSTIPGIDQNALKSITTTSPLNSGFVPFDLVAPSRLVYPVI